LLSVILRSAAKPRLEGWKQARPWPSPFEARPSGKHLRVTDYKSRQKPADYLALPYTHMGSPHWVGPISFMQVKLHGGASTCAPWFAGLAWAVLASASSDSASTAAKILFVVIGLVPCPGRFGCG
jgi:hypothetical protein